MQYTEINLFAVLVEYFALYAFLWIFFEEDPTRRRWRWCCHILMPALFFIFTTFVSEIHLRPMLYVLCSWFIAAGFQGDFWQRIFSVSVFQILLILLEFIVSYLLSPMADFSLPSVYLATNILMKLLTLLILFILFLCSKRRKIVSFSVKPAQILLLMSFSLLSFLLLMEIDYLLVRLNEPRLFWLMYLSIPLCMAVNIGLYVLFYQLAAAEEAKQRLQFMDFYLSQQKEQQRYLNDNHQEIRKLSHDLNRYLSTVFTLLQQGKTTEAMEELQKRQLEIAENPLIDTGYPILNSVLAYKCQLAQKQQVQMQLVWNVSQPLLLSLTDLAVILSNGLDNAIEAAAQVTADKPFVSLLAETDDHFLKLFIRNNMVAAPQMADGKICTGKSDAKLHGLGLESIKTLAHRYDGEAFYHWDDKQFTLQVILNNAAVETGSNDSRCVNE